MILTDDELGRFIDDVLAEDIGPGDVTANSIIPQTARLSAAIVAREDLVPAGLSLASGIFKRLAPDCKIETLAQDGGEVGAGATLMRVHGPARAMLGAERAALNILQHLSGIATLTRRYVNLIEGTGAILQDTRKTVPGLRKLAKYATDAGGARNHRMGLWDAILIKDNHIAIAGGVGAAIAAAKSSSGMAVAVECDTLAQVSEALDAGAERILLDNMSPATLREAVALVAGRIALEASGGITLETIREIADTGVDFISVGRLTHSAPAVDIAMDYIDD